MSPCRRLYIGITRREKEVFSNTTPMGRGQRVSRSMNAIYGPLWAIKGRSVRSHALCRRGQVTDFGKYNVCVGGTRQGVRAGMPKYGHLWWGQMWFMRNNALCGRATQSFLKRLPIWAVARHCIPASRTYMNTG